ncbi:MAG: serine hydrolase domain-containing protein [Vicinamibacterales bacterium]
MFTAARQALEDGLAARVFPAAVVEVGTTTEVLWCEPFGRLTFAPDSPAVSDDTLFDLASLTKVLVTTPLAMQQHEQGVIGLDDPLSRHLPAWSGSDRAMVTIRDLLSHCSGLPAHRPYFERLSGRAAFESAICSEALDVAPRTRAIYSDLGFILLGFLLAREGDLDRRLATLLAQMSVAEPLLFGVPHQWRRRVAPTAEDSWRGRLLVGEVDDQNAAALGGVCGHAGLFGTAAAVGACARHLLQVLDGRTGAFTRTTLNTFITRRADIPDSSRALGWDTMLPTSSCGTAMSPSAIGHTGFTGTSLWIDLERGVYVTLLTNRVHPDRVDRGIQQVRRRVHDAIMRTLAR